MAGWQFSSDLSRHLVIGAHVVRVIYLLRMAEISSGSSYEPNNLTEQKLGARLRVLESENDHEKKTRTLKSFNKLHTKAGGF